MVWHEIQWGTVAEWIAGVGVIALWFLERRERLKAQGEAARLRYEERERVRMAQIRQVEFGYSAWSDPLPPPGHHRWTIKNHSDRPLISYRFHGRMLDRPMGEERMRFGGGAMLMPNKSDDVVLPMKYFGRFTDTYMEVVDADHVVWKVPTYGQIEEMAVPIPVRAAPRRWWRWRKKPTP